MRRDLGDESVVVVPSVSWTPTTQRHPDPGHGGAVPVPAAAVAPAAAPDGLRDVDAGRGAIVEYYLALLPGVIPSHARARLHAGVGRRRVARGR